MSISAKRYVLTKRALSPQWWCALSLCGALCSLTTFARAEIQIEGTPAALRVTTSGATILDVFSALTQKFNVKSRIPIAIEAEASALYTGSFTRVISRLLNGYDYVIKRQLGSTEIIVLGQNSNITVPPAPPPPVTDFRPPIMPGG
jgi:hypothetical protein